MQGEAATRAAGKRRAAGSWVKRRSVRASRQVTFQRGHGVSHAITWERRRLWTEERPG